MTQLAPIAFFVYNRPQHTLKSLESLANNKDADKSDIFIFSEAPKNIENEGQVKEVRKIIRSKQWCKNVHIIEQEKNLGCANSIINGVTKLCEQYGRVIVVEDDLVLSSYFINYMNTALDIYEKYPRVMQISGYMFPVQLKLETDAFFLPFTTSWGWATWQRSWKFFEPHMLSYEKLRFNKHLRYEFDLNRSFPYFKMLEEQIYGKIDSWAIRWYLSVFMLNGITLYPHQSLVFNIGFDGSGTHCGFSETQTSISEKNISIFPKDLIIDKKVNSDVFKYLKSLRRY